MSSLLIGESLVFEFDNTFSSQLEGLYIAWPPTGFPKPELVVLNRQLAVEMRLDPDVLEKTGAELFAGNVVPEGAFPLVQAYAGHQFGGFSPQLGDGRALLLGEIIDSNGHRRDLQLKGSGPTPFSRGGDGRAALGPVLREYLIGEAMYRLGIPSTRALAAVTTGEVVYRNSGGLPGAVLARVASSHLRVGTFEFFVARGEMEKLRRLASYAWMRHFSGNEVSDDGVPAALLRQVALAQAELIAGWMLVGFVHGVMNTDNTTISGETIDYGPCAFMEVYDPNTVFSSIDHHGRYAYGKQPTICAWNLSRLGVALSPLMADEIEQVEQTICLFQDTYRGCWLNGMRDKLGLQTKQEQDVHLIEALLDSMYAAKLDFTLVFRELAKMLREESFGKKRNTEIAQTLESWSIRWRSRLAQEGRDSKEIANSMDQINPLYIPRNHLVEDALEAAVEGNFVPFTEFLDVLADPYTERADKGRYAAKAPPDFGPYKTFCGT